MPFAFLGCACCLSGCSRSSLVLEIPHRAFRGSSSHLEKHCQVWTGPGSHQQPPVAVPDGTRWPCTRNFIEPWLDVENVHPSFPHKHWDFYFFPAPCRWMWVISYEYLWFASLRVFLLPRMQMAKWVRAHLGKYPPVTLAVAQTHNPAGWSKTKFLWILLRESS